MKWLGQISVFLIICGWSAVAMAQPVQAKEGQVLGIHILRPDELTQASALLQNSENEDWQYVTIPLSLNDLEKQAEWQTFFDEAKTRRVIPLVRLVTRFENGAWQVPTRRDVTDLIHFLDTLNWPTDQKHIIVFNEVNHKAEWGGNLNPEEYSQILEFTSNWAHTNQSGYVVLPAAMDLAAPNGKDTMEAFTYLKQMLAANPEIFKVVDAWNSHSYPNPGFSSSPTRTAQNSLRGFEHELAFLKQHTGTDYQVYITETGWIENRQTARWLESYYSYAMQHIWSHPQVVAVTPFVLRGAPGPFSGFSFLDKNDKPTIQYTALQKALQKWQQSQT